MNNLLSNARLTVPPSARLRAARRASTRITVSLVVLIVTLMPLGCGSESASPSADESSSDEAGLSVDGRLLGSVDLGPFRIRETRPLENQKIDLQFSVQVAVFDENRQAFEQISEKQLHALRDQIITAIRTAESTEFDEPELKRIRRRMLLRIASIIDEPIVEDIYLTDFRIQVD